MHGRSDLLLGGAAGEVGYLLPAAAGHTLLQRPSSRSPALPARITHALLTTGPHGSRPHVPCPPARNSARLRTPLRGLPHRPRVSGACILPIDSPAFACDRPPVPG